MSSYLEREKTVLDPARQLASGSTIPRHVAIIMDGNGRWATSRNRPRSFGHLRGMECIRPVVESAISSGVSYLTLFAFSTENWSRDGAEISFLFRLFKHYMKKELHRLKEKQVRFRVIGERERLDGDLQVLVKSAEEETENGDTLQLTLAISYSGLDEIVHAVRSISRKTERKFIDPEDITRSTVAEHLYAPDVPEVDLLIRTGNEMRLSNFLLWRLAYAELVFLPTLWPDFTAKEFMECLKKFAEKERRFGRTRRDEQFGASSHLSANSA